MTYDNIKTHKKPGFSRSLEDFSKNYSVSVLIIKHFMVWKVMYCFLKIVQDFLCWITFTLAYLAKTPCFYILRKKLLLQQMRDYLLCKISTFSPATPSVSAFAIVAVQIMHASAVA